MIETTHLSNDEIIQNMSNNLFDISSTKSNAKCIHFQRQKVPCNLLKRLHHSQKARGPPWRGWGWYRSNDGVNLFGSVKVKNQKLEAAISIAAIKTLLQKWYDGTILSRKKDCKNRVNSKNSFEEIGLKKMVGTRKFHALSPVSGITWQAPKKIWESIYIYIYIYLSEYNLPARKRQKKWLGEISWPRFRGVFGGRVWIMFLFFFLGGGGHIYMAWKSMYVGSRPYLLDMLQYAVHIGDSRLATRVAQWLSNEQKWSGKRSYEQWWKVWSVLTLNRTGTSDCESYFWWVCTLMIGLCPCNRIYICSFW